MSFLCPAFFLLNNSILLILFFFFIISLLFIYLFIHSIFEHMPAIVPNVEIRVSFLSYCVGPGDLTQMVRLGIFNH